MKKPLVELTIEEAIALCRQRLSLLKQKENIITQQAKLIDELNAALKKHERPTS